MKINIAIILVFVFFVPPGFAAVLLKSPDGKNYKCDDWSAPKPVALSSKEGQRTVTKRSMAVTKVDGQFPETYTFDFLFDPEQKTTWAGPACDTYYILEGTICGATTAGRKLLIRKPESTLAATESEVLNGAVVNFLRGPKKATSLDGASYVIDLSYIFGRPALASPTDATPKHKEVFLRSTIVIGDTVKCLFTSFAKNELSVSFDGEGNPISASVNGKDTLILLDGKLPESLKWSPPRKWYVFTPNGETQASSCSEQRSSMRAVVLSTGELWFGLTECWLALFGERVVGIQMTPQRDLLFFAKRRTKLPVDANSKRAFKEELARFENERLLEDAKVNIAQLFAKEGRFANDPDLALKAITFEGENLVVTLKTNDPKVDLEVTLADNLAVKSNRTKPVGPWQLPRHRLEIFER